MLTAYMKNINDIILKDVQLSPLKLDQIRIKVDACSICGTDVSAAMDGQNDYKSFGHEVAGTVLEIGDAVNNVSVGQKVVLESSSACGKCINCRDDHPRFCCSPVSFWPQPPYGFSEEMIAPATCAVPYDGIRPEHAALAESLGVALDMFTVADIKLGSHVVVSGLGAIGLMALRLAKAAGAEKIYACDISKVGIRFDLARKFGADEIIEVDKTPVTEYKFDQLPDRFMITSPPKTIPDMIKVTASGAIISYIGIKYGDGANITFDANFFHFNKLQLRGSFAAPGLYIPKALNLIKTGVIDAESIITNIYSLNDISEGLKKAALNIDKTIKVVIKP